MADPYRLGYRDPPFRSKSLHCNAGVARLQLSNAPLQRRTDILIRQDVYPAESVLRDPAAPQAGSG
jgi:hypothetical protein